MYSVISNVEKLNQLPKNCSMPDVLSNEKVFKRLRADVECLNEAYGADRDLQADLGGYTVYKFQVVRISKQYWSRGWRIKSPPY